MVLKNVKIKTQGFTLVEILVAVVIFSVVVGIALQVFVLAVGSQRKILARQQILDQVSYVLEYMSRALRMAKKDLAGNCLATAGSMNNYETDATNRIRFLNYNSKCQEFFLEGGQLKERKSLNGSAANFEVALSLTSNTVNIPNFKIGPSDSWDQNDNLQPSVTFFLDIEGKEGVKLQAQTTVSQRNLDVAY